MRRFQKPVFQEINFSSLGAILDVSCGTGEFLKALYQKSEGKGTLVGIDLASEMVEKARQKLPPEVVLKEADAHQLPFKDHKFDYTITTEAFHHYYDQEKALQEMKRVTKSTGKVIIVDINFFHRPVHWLWQKLEPGCVKINNKKEMKDLFEKVGLKVLKQERTFLFAVMTVGKKEAEAGEIKS